MYQLKFSFAGSVCPQVSLEYLSQISIDFASIRLILKLLSCWTTLVDHSRLIDYLVSENRVKKYGRDHDR